MTKNNVTVLCLRNCWNGGYQCFDVFYKNILTAMDSMKIKYFIANTSEEAFEIYSSNHIDFSFCIGKFCFFYKGTALYDIFHIVNYEWVIDNPFKYSENTVSPYNRLIMIDDEFRIMPGFERKDYITLPLGIPMEQYNSENERINAILVPWKLKSLSKLEQNIHESPMKNKIFDFIESYDYDTSYIRTLKVYMEENELEDDRKFFRLSNDYIRMVKRITMLNSIKNYPIYIAADTPNPLVNGKNVTYLPTGNFKTTLELQRKYKYVLNNNPNYDMCLHDRVSHAISNGAIVISDQSRFMREINFPLTVKFSDFGKIDLMVETADKSGVDYAEMQRKCTEPYRINYIIQKLINHHLLYNKKVGDI